MLPRGGGTSQAGQTVNRSLVIDCSKHLNRVLDLDVDDTPLHASSRASCSTISTVNCAPHGLWFPVDVLDRVARYHRRHDRQQLLRRAFAALGQHARECASPSTRCWRTAARRGSGRPRTDLSRPPAELAAAPAGARSARASARARRTKSSPLFPTSSAEWAATTSMRCAPGRNDLNLAHILVGSEGTLAFSTRIELKLWLADAAPRASGPATSAVSTRRWTRPSTSCGSSRSRSNWSTAP